MWVRGAAIRPVPPYAVIDASVLARVEHELADENEGSREELDRAFARFESTQPELAEYVSGVLARPLDETALALGYFLSIAVWLAFERAFGKRLHGVTGDSLRATLDALTLEEELRAEHAEEPFDTDDVVALEQPSVVAFVHEHIDAALEVGDGADAREVDVDDVHAVYRSVLVITLALSHAVIPDGDQKPRELMA